jgi:DNA recombination protein RmuC
MDFVYLAVGAFLGCFVGWFAALYKYNIGSSDANNATENIYETLKNEAETYRNIHLETVKQLSASEQTVLHLQQKLTEQRGELLDVQKGLKAEFGQLASQLLEEKSAYFSVQHQRQLEQVLLPFKERIKAFEDKVEKTYWNDNQDRISLKKEIEQLRVLNFQLSTDAVNLTNALKGDSKTQGDWGEWRLELLLEKAGLLNGLHYTKQGSHRDEDGKQKRPDFVVHLPDDKHIIIDSKVSLTAYEQYFNEQNTQAKDRLARQHTESVRNHIRDLSSKNYQLLYKINTPDYVLLFVPIEPAFTLAVQTQQHIFLDALERNIVLVTPTTLLATLRTVSYIWRQEKQKKSVLEIARQSGLLYDKFCAFVGDLQEVGKKLDQATEQYNQAMNKLSKSSKYGDTLIGRVENIKKLGANTTKSLPNELLDDERGTQPSQLELYD